MNYSKSGQFNTDIHKFNNETVVYVINEQQFGSTFYSNLFTGILTYDYFYKQQCITSSSNELNACKSI